MAEKIMTLAQVAEYLQVPKSTLYMWRHKGVGPRGSRVGRHVRYRQRDVETWLDQQAKTA